MSQRVPPFDVQQIGVQAVRFPSGAPIPMISDTMTDPYFKTRTPNVPMIDALQFLPQTAERYPGIVLLHEWWGLTAQVKDTGIRLAQEGYTVLIPNLYGRLGGMVTAHADVAGALMTQLKDADVLQDLTSACEWLNTQDRAQRGVHGVVGFGMGGSYAIRFACHRKRLRAAVAFYGHMVVPPDKLRELACPLLYHQAGQDNQVANTEVEQLQRLGQEYGKRVQVLTYPDAPHGFMNDLRKDSFRPEEAASAWNATTDFLKSIFT